MLFQASKNKKAKQQKYTCHNNEKKIKITH